ncbi:hypothetical protein BLOT_008344, partial [Blomia tropicalis]
MKYLLVQIVLICASLLVLAQADGWNRGDEQTKLRSTKYGLKKHVNNDDEGFNGDDEKTTSTDDDIDTNQEIVNGDNGHGNLARTAMDNMARELRTKALSKTYQSYDSYPDSIGHGTTTNDAETDGNIQIAVQSKRRFEFVPVHFDREDLRMPKMIEIVSDSMPLRLHFKSQSAAIVVTQSHMSPPMKPIEETVSMDEPYRLSHTAHKPIIQEVKEVIQPYRNVVQHLKPVIEDIRTVVPKDSDINHNHQQGKPSFGGISGSVRPSNDWKPRYGHSYHLQSINGNKNNQRKGYDSVKGSESRPRIQRRIQMDERIVSRKRGGKIGRHQSPMQFSSSQPEMYYLPMESNENQRLVDYFAPNGYGSHYARYDTSLPHSSSYMDSEMAPSERYDRIEPNLEEMGHHSETFGENEYEHEHDENVMNGLDESLDGDQFGRRPYGSMLWDGHN